MQDKKKLIKKMNLYSLLVLFIGTMVLSLLNVPVMIINLVSFVASCVLYASILIEYKMTYHKYHKLLTFLGILCMVLQFSSLFYHNKVLSLIISMSIYAYYLYYSKLTTGQLNKTLLFFGVLICGSSFLGLFFHNKFMTAIFLGVEALVYLKLSNKLFTSIANKKKARLEREGFTDEDAKKVPLIRRILFGKTGKLDLGVVSMITGKDYSKKKINEN